MTSQDLKALADSLPPILSLRETKGGDPIITYSNELRPGAEILKRNPNAKDQNGAALDPQKKYFVKLPLYINHFKKLRKLYKTDPSLVERYCADVRELAGMRQYQYTQEQYAAL